MQLKNLRKIGYLMIKRAIEKAIIDAMQVKPVVLITGARQVGKSTLCNSIAKDFNYNYVSLDNLRERETAINDPELFLTLHKSPLIIDEVQYAPKLFEVIESIVNKAKLEGKNNKGMYILTGSQCFQLMQGVSQSMAGRVAIIEMSPLTKREIKGVNEDSLVINLEKCKEINDINIIDVDELYTLIVKGFYPELYDNDKLSSEMFYSDYVRTYLERDVSQLINLKDKLKFQRFLEVLASLTGEELITNNLAKAIGVSVLTIQSWISILLASGIIFLLEPYNENSALKRVVKRPKLYFVDTGLAAYLSRLDNPSVLRNSIFSGRFIETYIVNEIVKSFKNKNLKAEFYYYRDVDQREIDLVILEKGTLHFIECKSGISYSKKDINAFYILKKNTNFKVGSSAVICLTPSIYSIDLDIYCIPIWAI